MRAWTRTTLGVSHRPARHPHSWTPASETCRVLRGLWLAFGLLLNVASVFGQQTQVVIFDEDDNVGAGYYDASFGLASGGDQVALGGPGSSKLLILQGEAFSGRHSGLVQYRHTAGEWHLLIARPGWAELDLAEFDSLVFHVNGPDSIPAGEMPQVGLEDVTNTRSVTRPISSFFSGVDADTSTWQRVSVPLSVFPPDGGFDVTRVKTVHFRDGNPNAAVRTFLVDYIHVVGRAHGAPVSAPAGPAVREGDRSVILHWDANTEANLGGYAVYRATAPEGPYEARTTALLGTNHYVDFEVENGRAYYYRVRAVNTGGLESGDSQTVEARPRVLSDEEFLGLVQRTALDYFWYEANPENGLIRDRSTAGSAASIAAVGFGLSALVTGVERGWLTRDAARERVRTTLRTFWQGPQGPEKTGTIGYRGFFYHFLDMQTALRRGSTELSTVDTALLLGGVLHVGEYFSGPDPAETEIRALADSIYRRVDWAWAQARPPAVSHGWYPDPELHAGNADRATGFIRFDWIGYNEAMLVYILALGSPTHPVGPDAWSAWTGGYGSQWQTQHGYTFLTFPPLFGHQYSHVWIDFRGIRDAYMQGRGIDYFENSRRATLAARNYAMANPGGFADYGADFWGLTASDGPDGYRARGAPPTQNDNGTVAPTAAGGSYAFTPTESLAALRHMYDTYRADLWGPYGFKDALNPTQNWFASDFIGIDQGPILLMIENGRSGGVWEASMRNEALQRGLASAGFAAVTSVEEQPEVPGTHGLEVSPSPFRERLNVRVSLPTGEKVRVELYDVLGRKVAVLMEDEVPRGRHQLVFQTTGLAGGMYFVVLRSGGVVLTRPVVHVR